MFDTNYLFILLTEAMGQERRVVSVSPDGLVCILPVEPVRILTANEADSQHASVSSHPDELFHPPPVRQRERNITGREKRQSNQLEPEKITGPRTQPVGDGGNSWLIHEEKIISAGE